MAAILEDGSVLLSPLECGLIVIAETAVRKWWSRNALWHPDLLPVLAVMRSSAAGAALVSPPHRGIVPVVPNLLAPAGTEGAVSVHEASEMLKMSDRAVVKALHAGRLSGRQVDGSRRWAIEADSVEALMRRRAAA